MPEEIGFNYYWPAGDSTLTRVRHTRIQPQATVGELAYQLQIEIPYKTTLAVFKVSFEWADIQVGKPGEPHLLNLDNLLKVLNGEDTKPLEPSIQLQDILPIQIIRDSNRRYTYCSILAVSIDKIPPEQLTRRGDNASLDMERLSLEFALPYEDLQQIKNVARIAIRRYNLGTKAALETLKSPYNGRRFPCCPASSAPKPNLLMAHLFQCAQNSGNRLALDAEFWAGTERSSMRLGVLLGAPGSGKTTALMEYLCLNWGIYLLAKNLHYKVDETQDIFGSQDLLQVYKTVSMNLNLKTNINNDRFLTLEILKLLLSRLIVLDKLISDNPTFSPFDWLLLQTYPSYFAPLKDGSEPKSNIRRPTQDIFHAVYSSIMAPNRDILRVLIMELRSKLRTKLTESKRNTTSPLFLPVLLDEAHHLLPTDKTLWRFTAWGDSETPAMPFYTVVVDALVDNRIDGALIVAGTGLRLTAPPAVGRSAYTGGIMRTLNTSFKTVEDVQTYLQGLGIDGVSARVAYWLKGRPSFAARFAESVLQKDPLEEETSEVDLGASVRRIRLPWDLDEYLFEVYIHGTVNSTHGHDALVPRFERLHMSSERNAADLWTRFKRAVFLQMYQSGFYRYEDHRDLQLFECGVALIGTKNITPIDRRVVVELSEPLLVWAAIHYLYTEAPHEMTQFLKLRIADAPGPSGQGKVWEQTIPDALTNLFSTNLTATNIVWQKPDYSHVHHAIVAKDDEWHHDQYGADAEYSGITFLDWLSKPNCAVFYFPENEAGPDAATVTLDGYLILVQCKFTTPPSADNKTNKPTAFATLSSILPNTFYRSRKDPKKIFGQEVAAGKMETYRDAREKVQNGFTGVIGVVLAYGGIAWPQQSKTPAARHAWIQAMEVPYQPMLQDGSAGSTVKKPWTEGIDALYVFEGPVELEKLYDADHLAFLATLKGMSFVTQS